MASGSVRLIFCGTPDFAVPTLRAVVAAGHEVALAVTQPDRAVGRAQVVEPTPVKRAAGELGIRIVQPERIKTNEELRARLEGVRPEAILVVAYGRIIPQWMLDLPPLGNINLHGSLLPKYRGAAPIQWAIAEGEKVTGVTTMRIDAGLDTGNLLLAHAMPIASEATAVDLFESLAEAGAELMVSTLREVSEGKITPRPQDHALATYAPILRREDGLIDFARPAEQIYNRWRGFQPWPGAWTLLRGKKLLVHRMRVVEGLMGAEQGSLVSRGNELLAVCGGGTQLVLDEVQMEGKRRMNAAEFLRGFMVTPGERLGA